MIVNVVVPSVAPVQVVVPDALYAQVYFARGEQGVQGIQGPAGATGGAIFPTPTSFTPVWSGTGLAYSGGATGDHTVFGNQVFVNINVSFAGVTNFGTGQYSVTLPFTAAKHQDVFAGSVHDAGTPIVHWSLKGHLAAGSNVMTLWYLSAQGNKLRDEAFTHNNPFTLATADEFHLAFNYEKTA
jgi:hypothetical protein